MDTPSKGDHQLMSTPMVSKIWAHTQVKRTRIEYVWKIEDFSFCCKKYEVLESSYFSSNQEDALRWCLRLYTRGVSNELQDYMGLFLALVQDRTHSTVRTTAVPDTIRSSSRQPTIVVYTCCLLDSQNKKVNLIRCQPDGREFLEVGDSWGFPKFVRKDLLKSDAQTLLPDDRLTIWLDMCVFGEMITQGEDDKQIIGNDQKSTAASSLYSTNERLTAKVGKIQKKRTKTEEERKMSNEIGNNSKSIDKSIDKLKSKQSKSITIGQDKIQNIVKQTDLNKKEKTQEEEEEEKVLQPLPKSLGQKSNDHHLGSLLSSSKDITNFRRTTNFSCLQHTGKIDLSDFLLNQKFSDITLLSSEGQRLPAHRIVLANQSPVLSRLIDSTIVNVDDNDQEKENSLIELRNFNAEELQEVLRYLYTGLTCNFRLPPERLLPIADTLELNRLKDWCEECLLSRITIVNTPDLLLLADKHSARLLHARVMDFLRQNVGQIIESEGWTRMAESHPSTVADVFKYMINVDKKNRLNDDR